LAPGLLTELVDDAGAHGRGELPLHLLLHLRALDLRVRPEQLEDEVVALLGVDGLVASHVVIPSVMGLEGGAPYLRRKSSRPPSSTNGIDPQMFASLRKPQSACVIAPRSAPNFLG